MRVKIFYLWTVSGVFGYSTLLGNIPMPLIRFSRIQGAPLQPEGEATAEQVCIGMFARAIGVLHYE
jgi:hypothetical protein